jgi:hypothetical protein
MVALKQDDSAIKKHKKPERNPSGIIEICSNQYLS